MPTHQKPFEFIRSAKLDRVEQQESATKDSRQVIPIIFLGPERASAPDPLKADPRAKGERKRGPRSAKLDRFER